MTPRPKSPRRPAHVVPAAGLAAPRTAPFWKGDTAEKRLATRVAERATTAATKRAGKPAKGSKREKTPQQRLRRLQRALKRRKTDAGRASVTAQIKAIQDQLQS